MLRSEFNTTFDGFIRHYGMVPSRKENQERAEAWYQALHSRYTIAQLQEVMAKMIEADFAKDSDPYLPKLGRMCAMLKQLGNPHNPCSPYHCDLCNGGGTVALYRTAIGKYVTQDTLLRNPNCASTMPICFACACPAGARWAAGISDGRGTDIPPLQTFSIDVLDQGYEHTDTDPGDLPDPVGPTTAAEVAKLLHMPLHRGARTE